MNEQKEPKSTVDIKSERRKAANRYLMSDIAREIGANEGTLRWHMRNQRITGITKKKYYTAAEAAIFRKYWLGNS